MRPLLREFFDQQLNESVSRVYVDLSQCRGMDSTFMGTLVGYHSRFQEVDGDLAVLNPTDQNRKLLDMLGVSEVLPVIGEHKVPDLSFVTLDGDAAVSIIARAEIMRQAHEHLIKLSEANKAKFQPFFETLDRDLARVREAGPIKAMQRLLLV